MPVLPKDLVDLLADPETHEPLTLASDAQLAALKGAIAQGKARRRDGKAPTATFEGALLARGGRIAYPVEGGIANLLMDERLELSDAL